MKTKNATHITQRFVRRYQWGHCDACGGDLPMIDNDNQHPELPSVGRTGGECGGAMTSAGVCGAYRYAGLQRFGARARLGEVVVVRRVVRDY